MAGSDATGTASRVTHDAVYQTLVRTGKPLTATDLARLVGMTDPGLVRRRIDTLRADFVIEEVDANGEVAFRILEFKAFTGQQGHARQTAFENQRAKIS
jgi:DNA (cytosine-5)-methyltransferase 1